MATALKDAVRIACAIDEEKGTLTWTFPEGLDPIVFDTNAVHYDVRAYAVLHGLKQRGSDVMAIARDAATGQSASFADKRAALARIVEHYAGGAADWNLRASGERESGGVLLAALRFAYPDRTDEALREFVKKLTPGQKRAVMAHDKVKPHYDRLVAEQSKGVDADALLNDL